LHNKEWLYSGSRFNLDGYICLEFSILLDLACFFIYESVHLLIQRLFASLNPKFIFYIDIILLIIFAVDMVQTILTLVGLNKKFKKLNAASQDIRDVSDDIGKRVYERTMKVKSKREEFKEGQKIRKLR